MALNLEFEFLYATVPRITVSLRSPTTGRLGITSALVDTGAEISLFDLTIANRIGVELSPADEEVTISGVGGGYLRARLGAVEIALLAEPDLATTIPVAFATIEGLGIGNLVGLDVLSRFDFGISHSERLGYLGRAAR
jgi:predicted aspartyl protease